MRSGGAKRQTMAREESERGAPHGRCSARWFAGEHEVGGGGSSSGAKGGGIAGNAARRDGSRCRVDAVLFDDVNVGKCGPSKLCSGERVSGRCGKAARWSGHHVSELGRVGSWHVRESSSSGQTKHGANHGCRGSGSVGGAGMEERQGRSWGGANGLGVGVIFEPKDGKVARDETEDSKSG